jgi:hypothetical protein
MTLQVGGISKNKLKTNMLMSPVGFRTKKGCSGVVQGEEIEHYRPSFSSERAPHITKSVTL